MSSWKLTLVLCGIAGFSFIALGGPQQVLEMFPLVPETISAILLSGTPFQTTVAILSLLLVSIGLMPSSDHQFTRGEFLQAISLGCAIVVSACLALAIHFASGPGPALPGIVTSVAILQGTVGLCAASILIVNQETRSKAGLPMIANASLCAIAILFSLGPLA
ncbi:MAG: hypothetical protein VYD70_00780 [Planctomycetota bacterium]|nr:hypothetical protein [Planctomycetota bacterium]MEE2882239.1 hypothetical protein [Planctomycetota bacterium]